MLVQHAATADVEGAVQTDFNSLARHLHVGSERKRGSGSSGMRFRVGRLPGGKEGLEYGAGQIREPFAAVQWHDQEGQPEMISTGTPRQENTHQTGSHLSSRTSRTGPRRGDHSRNTGTTVRSRLASGLWARLVTSLPIELRNLLT